MKDCLRLHTDDEAREMRIGYLTMLLHTEKSEERRRELMRELEAMRAKPVLIPAEPTREILEAMGAVPERPTAGYFARVYDAIIKAAKQNGA